MAEILEIQSIVESTCPNMVVHRGAEDIHLDIVTLHSSVPPEEHERAFAAQQDKCRVILATNMAESSITLPDVDYVLDFGLHRQVSVSLIQLFPSASSTLSILCSG